MKSWISFVVFGNMLISLSKAVSISRACPYRFYKVEALHGCIPCPKCPEAYGMNAECRSYPPYREHGKLPQCVSCKDGLTYSEHESSEVCDPCGEPCTREINRYETRKCTRFFNRRCECKRGYFEGASGSCNQQCCYCDQQTHYQKKCKLDEMPNDLLCYPTRHDGRCDDRKLRPTTVPIKTEIASAPPTEASIVPSTTTTPNLQTMQTTGQPPTTFLEHEQITTKTASSKMHWIISSAVVVAAIVLVIVLYCCQRRKTSLGPTSREVATSDSRNAPCAGRSLLRQMSGSELHPYTRAPTTTSVESSPVTSHRDTQPTREYETVGPFLHMLSFGRRKELGLLLDKEGSGNWLHIGLKLAGNNNDLIDEIKACHQCLYGGGKQMFPVFEELSTRNPHFTIAGFNTIARDLHRTDVLITDSEVLGSRLIDVPDKLIRKIGDKLDKRADFYWPSFADKLGFLFEEIEEFRKNLKTPQKYSPTAEMICVLHEQIENLTIEAFRDAAISFNQPDCVAKLLDEITADFKT